MKIDLVRKTPTPPPIERADISCSSRELQIIAASILREGSPWGMNHSINLSFKFDPLVTEAELEIIKTKFKEVLNVR